MPNFKDIKEFKITDNYGDSLVLNFYEDRDKKMRVEAYIEHSVEEHDDYMIDNDIRIDVPIDELLEEIHNIVNQINGMREE